MKNAQIFVAFSEKLNFSSTKQCDDGAGGRSENLGVHEGICFASIFGKICTSKLYIPSIYTVNTEFIIWHLQFFVSM